VRLNPTSVLTMRPVWSTASAVPGHTLVQSDAGMIGNSRGALVRGENRSGFALQIATSVVPHMPLRGGEGAGVFAQVRMRPATLVRICQKLRGPVRLKPWR
jgi:hypothetical protein